MRLRYYLFISLHFVMLNYLLLGRDLTTSLVANFLSYLLLKRMQFYSDAFLTMGIAQIMLRDMKNKKEST